MKKLAAKAKMGRPVVEDRRSFPLVTYLTRGEHQGAVAKAEALGVTLAGLVRVLLGCEKVTRN